MHLANKVVKKLKDTQPELNITNNDVLCVKVAALCHDLGHGPFSHVFDGVLIPLKFKDTKWTHEEQSVKLLTHLLKVNKIDLRNYGLTEIDKTFIEEMITGKKDMLAVKKK
jgi:HD superfamily phosphohydrolase